MMHRDDDDNGDVDDDDDDDDGVSSCVMTHPERCVWKNAGLGHGASCYCFFAVHKIMVCVCISIPGL